MALPSHLPPASAPLRVLPNGIHLTAPALERLVDRVYRLGRLTGIREMCEALDELIFEDEGDCIATLAPWLAAIGIAEHEVAS